MGHLQRLPALRKDRRTWVIYKDCQRSEKTGDHGSFTKTANPQKRPETMGHLQRLPTLRKDRRPWVIYKDCQRSEKTGAQTGLERTPINGTFQYHAKWCKEFTQREHSIVWTVVLRPRPESGDFWCTPMSGIPWLSFDILFPISSCQYSFV